jgi:hypothetical protein
VKHAKKWPPSKRPIGSPKKERPSFAKALASIPNVGTDDDFARLNTVDEKRHFVREREHESGVLSGGDSPQ